MKISNLRSRNWKPEMGVDGFYQSAGADVVLEKYNQLKKDLEKAMEAWEEATEKL